MKKLIFAVGFMMVSVIAFAEQGVINEASTTEVAIINQEGTVKILPITNPNIIIIPGEFVYIENPGTSVEKVINQKNEVVFDAAAGKHAVIYAK